MEAISAIASLLLLIVIIVMFVGLINPKWIKNFKQPDKPYTRKQIFWGGVIGTVVFTTIGVITLPEVKNDQKALTQEAEAQAEEAAGVDTTAQSLSAQAPVKQTEAVPDSAKEKHNLGITAEEFRTRYNAGVKTLNLDGVHTLKKFDMTVGSVRDVFQVKTTDHVLLTGSVDKDGMLHELTFMYGGEGESAGLEGIKAVLTATLAAQAVNPDYKAQAAKALTRITTEAMDNLDTEDNTVREVFGDFEYYAMASTELGLWIGIINKNSE